MLHKFREALIENVNWCMKYGGDPITEIIRYFADRGEWFGRQEVEQALLQENIIYKKLWWVEFRKTPKGNVPLIPRPEPVYSETPPLGDYWGPYHCYGCAKSMGIGTERQAWEFNHGTDDEKFGAYLGPG